MQARSSSIRYKAGPTSAGSVRWFVAAMIVLVMSMLAGCATSKPRQIDITQAQMQEAIGKRFPYSARWLDAIDITATTPKLMLQPGAGTISADIDVGATDRVFGHSYKGNLLVASGLRYEPSDNSFRFTGVKVDRFGVSGLPAAYGPETARLGALLAQQLLENFPIYTLTPQQAQLLRDAGLKVSAMRISEVGLSITLVPLL